LESNVPFQHKYGYYIRDEFSEVIYGDSYAKILDWNFRLVDENSQILVVIFVSKLNFSFSFRFVDENCRIFVVVDEKKTLYSIRRYVSARQDKHPFRRAGRQSQWSVLQGRAVDARTSAGYSPAVRLLRVSTG